MRRSRRLSCGLAAGSPLRPALRQAALLAIALAWAIPAGISGGEAYRNAIFWGQSAGRVVDSFAHKKPIYWYLAILPPMLEVLFGYPVLTTGLVTAPRGLGSVMSMWSVLTPSL